MNLQPLYINPQIFKIWIFFGVIFMMMPLYNSAYAVEEFQNVLDRDGIKVFTRSIKGSSIEEIQGQGAIEAPLAVCVEVLKDIPGQTQWIANTKESKLVRRIDNDHVVYLPSDRASLAGF